MHHALRSSLAIALVIACAGCQTHDRRNYTVRKDKNLHVIRPFAPSTTKAASEATETLGEPVTPGAPDSSMNPGLQGTAPSATEQ